MPDEPGGPVVVDAIDDAAATLESIQEAIESESSLSADRQDELLREVRTCQTNLQTLLTSMASESPSIQQIMQTLGQMQTSIADLAAEVKALKPSAPAQAVTVVEPSLEIAEEGPRGGSPTTNGNPSKSESSTGNSPRRESSPSATPAPPPVKKKRYVKI